MLELDLRLALGGFELQVAARLGRSTAVLGPSGAGKTSLLESVAGLRQARGRVQLGEDTLQDTENRIFLPPERRHVGYVPQNTALFPHLSVRRNLLFGRSRAPGRRRSPPDATFFDLVDALGLELLLDRYPRFLSGGERRRVALGRALLGEPRLLLLDEPTEGLDAEAARRARGQIRRLTRPLGIPLLVVTHRQEDCLALAEEVLILEGGRIAGAGPTHEVLTRHEALARHQVERNANLRSGRVSRHDTQGGVTSVQLDAGGEVTIPYHADFEPGDEIVLSVDAEEVILATAEPVGLSARNVVCGEIDKIEAIHTSVYVRVSGWLVHLTAAAARELDLGVGRPVWLVVKTHSWRVLAG